MRFATGDETCSQYIRFDRVIESVRFGEVVVGVTGHQLLSATQSRHVENEVQTQLASLLRAETPPRRLRLISGLEPGADLVVTEALLAACDDLGLPCLLTAAIVDSPQQLMQTWLGRLEAQGQRADPAQVKQIGDRLKRLLQLADQQSRFVTPDHAPDQGAQQLAALLAETSDILIVVQSDAATHSTLAADETLRWWRDPEQIPNNLRVRMQRRPHALRRLIRIDPGAATAAPADELLHDLQEIRAHMRVGNALTAIDIAHRALQNHPEHPELRYLYLLSLTQSGSTHRALQLYLDLAPRGAEEDENWLALRGRLYKDLAYADEDQLVNLQRAAEYYEQAFVRFGSTFGGVNAAVTHALSGERDAAHRLAKQVCELSSGILPGEPRARYFHHTSLAEALAVLGDWAACRLALRSADQLLRDDLSTRARTRSQLRRVALAQGADPAVAHTLTLPAVYVLEPVQSESPPALSEAQALQLRDAPLYAALPPTRVAGALVHAGMRLHFLGAANTETPRIKLERAAQLAGFHTGENKWFAACAQRHIRGLAELNARQLQVEVQSLALKPGGPDSEWLIGSPPRPPQPKPPRGRQMVGLLFTDLVGFGKYSDEDIDRYWQEVLPALAQVLKRHKRRILVQKSWGDAIHLVTRDALSVAQISQDLLLCVQALRELLSSVRLEMRVGAHFAPATQGRDAIERCVAFFGSQLALTARVEPVTPPSMTYVTEELAAELSLVAPDEFRLEYAGEVPLAKNFGANRLYSLQARQLPP